MLRGGHDDSDWVRWRAGTEAAGTIGRHHRPATASVVQPACEALPLWQRHHEGAELVINLSRSHAAVMASVAGRLNSGPSWPAPPNSMNWVSAPARLSA